MDNDEITIKELLQKFELKINLPKNLLNFIISSDFLDAKLLKDKSNFVFIMDNVKLIINPSNNEETIKKVVEKDGKIIGGVILGYNKLEYIN